MHREDRCTLADRRTMAYAQWGDPDGTAVLYCHGFPGSRLEARLADAAARRLGIRLIAPDRPGFGRSSPCPGRRLSDWPADLVQLVDHLELERFHLIGISGGAPYALACGQQLAARIRGLAIVCGLGELDTRERTEGMNLATAANFRFYQQAPSLAHWTYSHLIGPVLGRFPQLTLGALIGATAVADREVLNEPSVHDAITDSFTEAFRAGSEGPTDELGLFSSAWDIDPTQVSVPTRLWHGEDDNTVPVAMGRRHAAMLPDCRASFLPGEGHFSLLVHHMDAILDELISIA